MMNCKYLLTILLVAMLPSLALAIPGDADDDGVSDGLDAFPNNPGLSAPAEISVGGYHTCALDITGVTCWGLNDSGQTDVPYMANPSKISSGELHSCAMHESGVVCWGDNTKGQIEVPSFTGSVVSISAGGFHTCALLDNGVDCWGDDEYDQTTVPQLSNTTVLHSGRFHTCAIDDNGLSCWGDNEYSQTLVPSDLVSPVSVSAGSIHTCAQDANGVSCWGDNEHGQTEAPELAGVQSLNAGGFHNCVELDTGIKCWGFNAYGGEESLVALSSPLRVSTGLLRTCFIDDSGVSCWSQQNYRDTDVPGSLDTDGDGVPNSVDFYPMDQNQTGDKDADGIRDTADNCPDTSNANQSDRDADGLGDTCDSDNDDDGMPDDYEEANGLDSSINDANEDLDGDGISNVNELLQGTDPNNSASVPDDSIGEYGVVSGIGHDQSGVSLAGNYSNPVVLLSPVTGNDSGLGVARISSLTESGFDVRFQEWQYQDGIHAAEDVSYLVIESGHYMLDDGTSIEVGTFDLTGSNSLETIAFAETFTGTPAMFLAVQSDMGTNAVAVRAQNVTSMGFAAMLVEEEALLNDYTFERVGYVAIYNASGASEIPLLGGLVDVTMTEATIQGDGGKTIAGTTLVLQEEQSMDDETTHGDEQLSILNLEGSIFAQDISSNDSDPVVIRQSSGN
jgi:hypothetical protein